MTLKDCGYWVSSLLASTVGWMDGLGRGFGVQGRGRGHGLGFRV